MGRLSSGFGGSHRSQLTRELSRAARAAEFGSAARQSSRAASAAAYNRALQNAMAKAQAGRMGAFGVPGRAPRMPYRPGFRPRLPGWGGLAFNLAYTLLANSEWARWPTGGAPSYDLTGWNVLCTSDPNNFPTENNFKVGINPGALIGTTNVSAQVCVVSSANTANATQGITIPAGATYFQAVQSGQPMPNRNGRVWMRANFPGGSVNPVPYAPGKTSAPIPDGVPPPAEEREMSAPPSPEEAVGPAPGAQPSTDWDFGTGGPPTVTPGWHYPVPPARGEREEKFKLGKGGIVGDIFGTITEIGDFVDCLYKATGATQKRGIPQMTAYVAKHFDITNPQMVAAAIKCLILNHLEDMVIGKFGQVADKAFIDAMKKLGGRPARGVSLKRPAAPEGFQLTNRMR